MLNLNTLHTFSIVVIPLLLAITLHEAGHAWMAYHCGDDTAKSLGRITLNPIKHIDIIGTIILPSLLILSGAPFVFGWAKPVPVNYHNLNNPRRDMALVAIAGPLANLLMLILWTVIIYFTPQSIDTNTLSVPLFIFQAAQYGIIINIILMVLNMLPIPPLDGSKILASVLPQQQVKQYNKIAPYGLFILIALMTTGTLTDILQYSVIHIIDIINQLFRFLRQ
jgi:Zn-dependent protease